MTQRTKAEKIAASLRARRGTMASSALSQYAKDQTSYPTSTSHGGYGTDREGVYVYVTSDLRKTFVVTLCITALLTLVYVLQYKGYF